jgi:hypothetical protein
MSFRLHQQGQVVGWDTTWLHVCFDHHQVPVLLRSHLVRVLDSPGGRDERHEGFGVSVRSVTRLLRQYGVGRFLAGRQTADGDVVQHHGCAVSHGDDALRQVR